MAAIKTLLDPAGIADALIWYDVIELDFDIYSYDGDELLHARSALEFARAGNPDLEALAERIDAYWRERPQVFNCWFALHHAFADRENELEGFAVDERGRAPRIPPAHWWWRPLPAPAEH